MNTLTIDRSVRFVAFIINMLFLYTGIGIFVNWFFYAHSGRTVGSIILRFRTVDSNGTPPCFVGSIKYFLSWLVYFVLIVISVFSLLIFDISTFGKRDGNFCESLLKFRKITD